MRKLIFLLVVIISMTTVISYLFFLGSSVGYAGNALSPVVPLMGFGP